jgi:hypothetical protein
MRVAILHDRRIVRLALALIGAALFGVAMSLFKGNGSGVRDDVGNLSAPWLLVPFFAAAVAGRRSSVAAAVGLAASSTALISFYVANAFVLDLGTHSVVTDIRLVFVARWFLWSLVSGPVLGAVGGIWSRGVSSAGIAVTALLVAEPVFWAIADRTGGIGAFAFEPSLLVSLGEATVGVLGCTCMLVHGRTPLATPAAQSG